MKEVCLFTFKAGVFNFCRHPLRSRLFRGLQLFARSTRTGTEAKIRFPLNRLPGVRGSAERTPRCCVPRAGPAGGAVRQGRRAGSARPRPPGTLPHPIGTRCCSPLPPHCRSPRLPGGAPPARPAARLGTRPPEGHGHPGSAAPARQFSSPDASSGSPSWPNAAPPRHLDPLCGTHGSRTRCCTRPGATLPLPCMCLSQLQ